LESGVGSMNKRFGTVTIFSSVQWLFFIFANTVMIPISVGAVFQLPSETIAMMLRVSLVFTGLASIFQGWAGHRYPLMEGHSGLLWGVILNLGLSASSLGMSFTQIGGGIATGVLLASAVTLILAAFNGISLLKSIFNPMVMSVYLFLLTFQLIFIFFKGMMKVSDQGTIDVPITLYSFALVIFVSLLKLKGNGIISNFSILIGLLGGWIGYDLLFMSEGQQGAASAGEVSFTLFPLGQPNLEVGIIAVTFFAGLMNLSNTVASISSADTLFKKESGKREYRGSIFFTAVFTVIGSGFGLVPFTPFTSSIGFLQSTRILMKTPFFLGGALLALIGMIPPLGSWLAGMPVTVGNAVLFVAYLQLFGTAFNSLNGKTFNSDTIFRLAAPVLIGISLMNTPAALFADLPVLIQPFISNGLIMGVLISILMEKMVNWSAFEQFELKNN
jgi:xanthine/uracil permease